MPTRPTWLSKSRLYLLFFQNTRSHVHLPWRSQNGLFMEPAEKGTIVSLTPICHFKSSPFQERVDRVGVEVFDKIHVAQKGLKHISIYLPCTNSCHVAVGYCVKLDVTP